MRGKREKRKENSYAGQVYICSVSVPIYVRVLSPLLFFECIDSSSRRRNFRQWLLLLRSSNSLLQNLGDACAVENGRKIRVKRRHGKSEQRLSVLDKNHFTR